MKPQPEYPNWMKPVEPGRLLTPGYSNREATLQVETDSWEFVCSARFGESRPASFSKHATWTGDSYLYYIFKWRDEDSGQYAIRWENGSGCGWLIADDKSRRGESCLLATIAAMPSEKARWDACHFLYETVEQTRIVTARNEFDRVADAFVNGRLKKRKKRGENSYTVTIEPRSAESRLTS